MLSQSLAILTKGLRLTAGDCSDVAAQGPYASGIYTITPWDDLGNKGSFKVFCDMKTDDAGWTVFQKRINGSVDFYRDWVEYKNGFGDLDGEFWLGLDKLNRLTSTQVTWQLKVELEDFEGNTAYALYDDFHIGDELTQFQLSIGTYSGTAGDALRLHEGMKFSTKDKDNDIWSSDCASTRGGAWWYGGCEHSNLNGPYLTSATSTHRAITWYHWKSTRIALKKAQMKIRPIV
ncbi:fibrinogen C domain-containing protein 1-A-like [Amphiura filiformis]|uniref:fibrinogen C domain-containing protein 1-A-like n=1 Tax=Amphiura filiformis TaxID=82378 RepID=UPI003B224238